MASIIADLSDDIEKLQSLKAEIQEVKRELGSINVKVELDIKRDMEARLQSLTKQYDALVQKVAQAEGKIAESTERINKSAETIIKAQERMTKAASGQGAENTRGASGGHSEATEAQTASVKAQAKAYDELADEIDSVMGTRAQNIKRMVEEQNAIRLINEELNRTRKLNRTGAYSESEARRIEQLNDSLLRHKTALSELRQSLNNSFKLDNAAATSMNALSQSLARMRMTYRELTEEERESPFGKELLLSIQQADTKIKQLDAAIGNHQRNVGNYASGWNGLSMSIQQIGRELPSLAMGWNTFFLAISNNLPILTDEIKRAKDEYSELKKAGEQATPVWRQVVSSLLSWQTALTVGITLLTVYGKEIVNWIGGLFNGEKRVNSLSERIKTLNEIQKEAGANAAKERSELDVLYKATQDHTRSLEERNAAADELQRRYPKYFENLSNEAILAGNAAQAYRQLTGDILKAAQARAAQDKITKNYERIHQLQRAINADTNWTNRHRESSREGTAVTPVSVVSNMGSLSVKQLTDEAIEYNRRVEALKNNREELNRLMKDNEYYAGLIDVESLTKGVNEGAEAQSESINNLKDYLDELAGLRQENEEREVDLMREGTEKRLAEIELRYKRIREKVQTLEADLTKEQGGKLSEEQLSLFSLAYGNIDSQRERDRNAVIEEADKAQKEAEKAQEEALKANEEAMSRYLKEYGTFLEKRQAITDEYSRKIAEAGGADTWAGKALQKELEEALSALNLEELKESINWELVFSDLSGASRKSLEEVKRQLRSFRESAEYKDMAVDQKKVVDEALNKIKDALIDKGGLLGDLPDQLNQLRAAQEELIKAQEEYNDALRNGTDADKEAARKKLNEAEKNKENAESGVNKAAKLTADNLTTLANAVTELGSSSEMTLSQLGGLIGGLTDAFAEAGKEIGGIIGSAFSLLDSIGSQGLDGFIGNALNSVFNAMHGAWDTVFGWTGIDFGGESDERLAEDIERLTASNQDLERAVDGLSEKMEDAPAADVPSIYAQQREYLEQAMRNTQEMMRRSGAAHSDGFLGMGGEHSSNKRIDEAMSAADWRRVSDVAGRAVDSAADFWSLTSEEMGRVADGAADLYAKIKGYADDGHADAALYMDEYIQYYKQLEALDEERMERLTSTSFDSVKDDFRSALLDMESDAEAFADSFEEMMRNAVLEDMMKGEYDNRLKEWYRSFSGAIEGDGLDAGEQERLREQWQAIVDDASAQWQGLKDAFGWDDSSSGQQSATSRAFGTEMTQEQGAEISGRLTALYESGLRLEGAAEGIYNVAEDARSLIAQSYLELQQISENTGAVVKPIKQMQLDIAEMKRALK